MTYLPQPTTPGDQQICLILSRKHGFFSLLFQVIGQAYLSEKKGAQPVVYFNGNCPYWGDAGYKGERNVWTYFFEPLSTLTTESLFPEVPREVLEAYDVDDFLKLCAGTPIVPTSDYPDVVEYKSPLGVYSQREFVHDLLNRYVVVKPHLQAKVEAYETGNFSSHTVIGVHYRGIEKAQGAVRDWVVSRRTSSPQDFFLAEIRSRLRANPGARVFIATDSADFLARAQKEFGAAVLSRQATRLSKNDEVIGLHFNNNASGDGPLLGEEVLLDALLLARTDFLIHGISNVSNAALCFNPALRHCDVEFRHGRTAVYLKREIYRRMSRISPRLAGGLKRLQERLFAKGQS